MKETVVVADGIPRQSGIKSHWSWIAAIGIIVILTVALRYALPVRDGDIWFHLLYGEYFWQHKTLLADHTLFSWTPSTNDTIYCTWLSDVFFYFCYKITGITGLFVFRYLCIYMLVFSCYLFARKMKIVNQPVTWLVCLLATLMAYTGIIAKPEIFSTAPQQQVIVRKMERYVQNEKKRLTNE